ncbi:zinc finger CCCH domain-containing protein 16 isoform X2 [Hevea brasiliensis]|uniref:zinc finger CCCH domain-containing protein 16 isoform X2 n=1 Tax=Hevea brasiliensis TaxID=3981 RepID=UPI0025FF2033|nr:zinc finger CCCH domain-containing protein 16 isoform X2 [Hevea brasiliensis]
MPIKKELCRNFQRGSCQYGERCKFLHVTPQQQQKPNNNAFGFGSQQQQQQNRFSNPFGFGVQSKPPNDFANKQQQFKPFENKWTRFSPISNGGTSSRQPDNQPQAVNHKCTDPDSCKRLIVEDFEHEKPLWKLTCYGHLKNGPCDIVGDISYEELRAAAYDDAKHGLSLQSIVERERNLLNSKLTEFENLLRNPYVAPQNSALSQGTFPGVTPNAISTTGENNAPPAVSSFSQLGASLNMGSTTRPSAPLNNPFGQPNLFSNSSQSFSTFGIRPSASSNNAFGQPNFFSNASQTSSAFGTNSFTPANAGFSSRTINNQSSPFSSAVSTEMTNLSRSSAQPLIISNAPNSASNAVEPVTKHVQSVNGMQRGTVSGDASIWLKENWIPGEIPEEAPPDQYI